MVLQNLYQPPVIVKLEEGEVAEGYLRSSQISSTSDCLLLIPEEKGGLLAFRAGEGSTAENSDHNKVLHMPKTVKGSKNDNTFADKRSSMP